MPVTIKMYLLRSAISKFLLLSIFGLVASVCTVVAQTWEIGATVNASGYIGDFNPNNPLKFTDAGFGVLLKRNFNKYLSAKVSFTHAAIQGTDSESANAQMQSRNLNFTTSFDEVSLIGELNFFSYIPSVTDNVFTPFIFAGIGTTSYNPQATYNGQDYDLSPLMTEGQQTPYKESAIVIPFGAGIKYNFAGAWNFNIDLGYRLTNTGYLDDVYGYYPDKSTLATDIAKTLYDRSGERTGNYIGTAGMQRGNLRNDSYMFLGFTISYTFLTSKCYSFN